MDIKKELNSGKKTIYIPNGRYLINAPLYVPSNITIIFDYNAVLLRTNNISHIIINQINNKYGYTANGNINIIGGILDMNGSILKTSVQGIAFGHAENILIKDTFFVNGYNHHMLEINAVKNANIINCSFNNMYADGDRDFTEMLQIDLAKQGTYHKGYYDNTPCENIAINNCKFTNGYRAIGTHSNTENVYNKDIYIAKNKIKNMTKHAIRGMNWDNVHLIDNKINNCNLGIKFDNCKNINNKNNIMPSETVRYYDNDKVMYRKDYYNKKGFFYKSRRYTSDLQPIYTKYYKNDIIKKEIQYDIDNNKKYIKKCIVYYDEVGNFGSVNNY